MWSLAFWKAATERSAATAAQTAIALLGVDILKYQDANLKSVIVTSAIAAILSYMKSISVAGVTDGSPSLGNVERIKRGDHAA